MSELGGDAVSDVYVIKYSEEKSTESELAEGVQAWSEYLLAQHEYCAWSLRDVPHIRKLGMWKILLNLFRDSESRTSRRVVGPEIVWDSRQAWNGAYAEELDYVEYSRAGEGTSSSSWQHY